MQFVTIAFGLCYYCFLQFLLLLVEFCYNCFSSLFQVTRYCCFCSLLLLLSAICYNCFLQYVIIAFWLSSMTLPLVFHGFVLWVGFYLEFQT